MFRNFSHLAVDVVLITQRKEWKEGWKFIKKSLKKKFSARLGRVLEFWTRYDVDEDLFDVHVEENIILNSSTTWPR